ncbi:MAG TPA: hypothetical protein VF173_31930 [Thermoanaerobaculia bacterium]|nr:hypothetical protein [Thermoanaerobaculia bacterium]
MATSSATIAVNFGTSLFLTLVSNTPDGTVAVSGTDVSLLPQSTGENEFDLLFQPGSGVISVNGILVRSVSSSSVSVATHAGGGTATAICTYKSFQSPAPTATFNLIFIKQTFELMSEDPTIVFNPPSGVGGVESVEALVAAEAVLV